MSTTDASPDAENAANALADPERTVVCSKLKKEAPALREPPLFGKLGKEVFANVSAEAWAEWVEMQLKIVNEYHLDLSEKEHRKVLEKQMRAFLELDDGASDGAVLEVGTPTEEAKGREQS